MADKNVDTRGLSCPEPVLLVKQAIESLGSGAIEVLADTTTSRDNITRMATRLGWAVRAEDVGGGFRLTIEKR